jgi:23S rRNA pseudouridine1911/1915/1917 synthase
MSSVIEKTFIIDSKHHGQRIDVVLAELLSDYSRSQIIRWIKDKQVLLNQKTCQAKDKLKANDLVELKVLATKNYLEEKNWQPEAIVLNIIYEDEEILVINKPAGLVVHPGAGNLSGTVVNALLYHYPKAKYLPRAGIVHRLDKDTTGLMVIAKTLEAHHHLILQMQAREVKRQYLALVQGSMSIGGTIETAFGRHPRNRLKMAVTKEGKEAITQYEIREQFPDFSLLDVNLLTGRTHQIRVHMAHINHPIIGDPLYGRIPPLVKEATESYKQAIYQFQRQALHAAALQLKHPMREEQLSFKAELPKDFDNLINIIRTFYDSIKS